MDHLGLLRDRARAADCGVGFAPTRTTNSHPTRYYPLQPIGSTFELLSLARIAVLTERTLTLRISWASQIDSLCNLRGLIGSVSVPTSEILLVRLLHLLSRTAVKFGALQHPADLS